MTYARADFLNLAAAWKEVIDRIPSGAVCHPEEIEARRRYFFSGALAQWMAVKNICDQHKKGRPRDVLLVALQKELLAGCEFMKDGELG